MKLLKEYIKILINESPKTSRLSSTGDKKAVIPSWIKKESNAK